MNLDIGGVDPNTVAGQLTIFRRNLKFAHKRFKIGDNVQILNSAIESPDGVIEEIYDSVDKVAWVHKRPYFIVVKCGEKRMLCTPSKLRKIK